MYISTELIHTHGVSCMNCLNDWELSLRSLDIARIENLGVTLDQYHAIDLSHNKVRVLGNFPRLKRLQVLVCTNNWISRIEETSSFQIGEEGADQQNANNKGPASSSIGDALTNLECLILTNNRITSYQEIYKLRNITNLQILSLIGNPIAMDKNYRYVIINSLPQLLVLDFIRISDKERMQAKQFGEEHPDYIKNYSRSDGIPTNQSINPIPSQQNTLDTNVTILDKVVMVA
eukprot:g383.t1